MINDIEEVFFSEEKIAEITKRLGEQISNDYKGKNLKLIGVLRGCLPFMSDLVKNITIPCTLDYISVKSYQGTASTGVVTVKGNIPEVEGKDIIIVEDILDTGRTLNQVKKLFGDLGAASVSICVFLDKPEGRLVDIKADYIGDMVPNKFVVGYGLDYNEYYRNLPFVGVLKEEVYKK